MTDIKSGIIVESGYTLTLDGFLWIEGCLDAWESILVKDGGTLIIRGNVHISGARQAIIVEDGGTLIIRGNAFIFDNWDGIVANSSSLNGANPNIFIDGAVFAHAYFLLEPRFGEKANRGIKLDKVTAGVTITGEENGGNLFYDLKTGIDLTQSSISVSDSEFSNFWSVLPRGTGVNLQHSKIGIKMNEAPVFSFLPFTATMGPTAQGTSGNTFKSLDIGVLAQSRSNAVIMRRNALDFVANGVYLINGAAATISNNRITSRHHGIYSVGTTPYLSQIITDNTFEATFDCNFPSASFTFGMGFIDLGSAPLFQSRFIRNNKIDMLGARYGLLGANMVNCSIFDNDIKWLEEENGIESPYPYESLGLYLINTGLASINNNLVEGLDLPNFELADGMRFENMLAPNISCNTVDYVGNGIHFIGMNNNSFFAANDIYNAETGLRLGEGDVEAIIGQQGNATKQNANEWLGSYGNIGALNNSSDLFTLESSLFTLSTENDLDYLPSNNQNANVWFADLEPQLVDPVGCPPNQPPEPSGLIESDPYLNALMNGGDIFNSAWTAAEWMGHTRLKELDETGRIDPSQFSNYSKWANSPIQVDLDKHWDYLDKINELYTFDSLDMYHYELFNENIGALTLEMDTLHTLLDTNSVDFDSTLIADRAELITDLNNLYTANATLIADMQSEIVFDMSKLTTAASNLPQTTQVQKDYKTMQGYYLDLLQSDSSNILTDSVIIIDLADACPLMKGEGVYTARALLAAVGIDRTYDDNANCQLPPSRPGLTNIGEENFAVSIAPNPFRGEDLTVRYPAGEYQNIELVNTLGQSFGQQVITEGQSMTVFGSEIFDQLPSGILFVRLSGEDVEPVTSQVILR
ncbi:MAG: T9SS type A sorting domain-containing protein [Bacteroidota bacterium]